jgi:hypothetical protein
VRKTFRIVAALLGRVCPGLPRHSLSSMGADAEKIWSWCSAGPPHRTPGTPGSMTDNERLGDIKDKLLHWKYLSSHPAAECDVAWLLNQLDNRDERIAELEARLKRNEWCLFLP